jgi:hypothetical protein
LNQLQTNIQHIAIGCGGTKTIFCHHHNLSIQFLKFEDLPFRTTFKNENFLFGKLVSLGSSGPKMGFKEVGYGNIRLMGPRPLNGWFLGDL